MLLAVFAFWPVLYNAFLSLTSWNLLTAKYVKQFIDEGTVQGHLWWAPFARSTPMFYFNRSVLSKAGLPDRGPKTWDEYLEWAPDIMGVTSPSGGQVSPLTLCGGYSAWYFQGNMWQWKGNYSDGLTIKLDEPAGLEAGQCIVDFIRKAKAAYLSANNQIDLGNGAATATLMNTASLTQTPAARRREQVRPGYGVPACARGVRLPDRRLGPGDHDRDAG